MQGPASIFTGGAPVLRTGLSGRGKGHFSCVLSSEEKRISRERKESGPGQEEVSVQSLRGQHCHLRVAWPRSGAGVTSCVKERQSNQTGSPS